MAGKTPELNSEMNGRAELKTQPILLVEDNQDDVELTIRALRRNEIPNEVLVAGDGQIALEMLGVQTGDTPSLDNMPVLVLMDIQLPRLDGLTALKRIRENEATRYLPVVILTSSLEERDRAEAYSWGANSYVQKPIHSSEFVEAVGRLGLFWLLDNQPA